MITDLQNTNNNWIYQSNKLIEASYTLTVMEQKVIRLLASIIKKDDDDFKEYEFKTKDLIKILNTSDSRFYRDIDNITDLLMQRIIKIKDINTGDFEKYHWVDICKYKNGILKLKINKELKPFYLSLDWYTKYQIKNIMQFRSTYSFRLYELFKQYENIGHRVIAIDNLRNVLDIDKKQYPKYANLKQKVINVALKEINSNTDLLIEFEELKEIRKVTSIKFYITSNKSKNEMAVASEERKNHSSTSKIDNELVKQVQAIIKNITGDEISDKVAKTFYTKAVKHKKYGDAPFELIGEVAEYSKTQNKDKGFAAWFTGTVEHYIRPCKQNRTEVNSSGTFNNFEQRVYDFEDLENKLLGIK